jgi:hypothetical protein
MLYLEVFLFVDIFSPNGGRNLQSQLQNSVECLRVQVEPILTFIEATNESGIVRQVRDRLASWERRYLHTLNAAKGPSVIRPQISTSVGVTEAAEALSTGAVVAATGNQPELSASPVSPIASLSNSSLNAPSSATYAQPTVPGTDPLVAKNPALDANTQGVTIFEDILKGPQAFPTFLMIFNN